MCEVSVLSWTDAIAGHALVLRIRRREDVNYVSTIPLAGTRRDSIPATFQRRGNGKGSVWPLRRTKVIGRFPGEQSCLALVWAVLDLQINNACNEVKRSEIDRQRLYRLRYEPGESEAEQEEVTAA